MGDGGSEPTDLSADDRDSGLAAAAHEIRAPLLAVKAALESALAGGEGVDPRRLLARSLAEVERLAGSIEDLLRWAIDEAPLRRRPADVVALVSSAVRGGLDPNGDRVLVQSARPVMADVDPAQLEMALANLIRNGLTYGEPTTTVEVSVRASSAAEVEVAVTNSGTLGPDPDDGSLYLPGMRRDPLGRNPGGRGFGLSIAKRVVEAHGGRIWYESTDRETTFFVRLERLPS